jgi:hypothetical protein
VPTAVRRCGGLRDGFRGPQGSRGSDAARGSAVHPACHHTEVLAPRPVATLRLSMAALADADARLQWLLVRASINSKFQKLAPVAVERCKRSPTRLVGGHCETEEGPLGTLQVGKASRCTGMNEDAEPEILTYRAYRERQTLLDWRRRQRAYEQSQLSREPEWGSPNQTARITDRSASASPSLTT